MAHKGPKILTFDIETWAFVVKAWQMGEQYLRHQRIVRGRSIASIAAKYMHEKEVRYFSTEGQRNIFDDRKIVKKLQTLINSADIIITQNGKRFDVPIVLGRLGVHKLGGLSKFKHYDTRQMGSKLGLPSSSLDYLTSVFAPEHRKLKHKDFPGDDLWDECEAGNKKAWNEMRLYNIQDVLGTEAVFKAMAPLFDIDFSVYYDSHDRVCSCGSTSWSFNGYDYLSYGKFKRWKCKKCGANLSERGAANNLLSKDKRDSLRRKGES